MSNQSKKPDDPKKIAEQFAGLDMKSLIEMPLKAVADAQPQLTSVTAEFLEEMNFLSMDPNRKTVKNRDES